MSISVASIISMARSMYRESSTVLFTSDTLVQFINDCMQDISHFSSLNALMADMNSPNFNPPFRFIQGYVIAAASHDYDLFDDEVVTALTIPANALCIDGSKGIHVEGYENIQSFAYTDWESLIGDGTGIDDTTLYYTIIDGLNEAGSHESKIVFHKALADNLKVGIYYITKLADLTVASNIDTRLEGHAKMIRDYLLMNMCLMDGNVPMAEYWKTQFLQLCLSFARIYLRKSESGRPRWKKLSRNDSWLSEWKTEYYDGSYTSTTGVTIRVLDGGSIT